MKILRTGIIQQTNCADIEDNRRRLADKIRRLAADGAELIVNQELHDSLYFCQTENVDLCGLAVAIPGDETDFYASLARECGVVLVTSLFERRAPGLYHNTAVVFEKDGSIAGKYRKMHIPDDPAYYEKFYFTPGDIGFSPIQTSVGRLGVLVCWDQWYPEAARLMALAGAEILIYPTAIGWESSDSPEEQERQREAWTTVQRARRCKWHSRCRSQPRRTRTRPIRSDERNHILGVKLHRRTAGRIPLPCARRPRSGNDCRHRHAPLGASTPMVAVPPRPAH